MCALKAEKKRGIANEGRGGGVQTETGTETYAIPRQKKREPGKNEAVGRGSGNREEEPADRGQGKPGVPMRRLLGEKGAKGK